MATLYALFLVIESLPEVRTEAGGAVNWFADWSWESILHLAIPSAVLTMEVYVIYRMAVESRERAQTVSQMQELTARSRRSEYMLDIARCIQNTKAEAQFTTASMEVSCKSASQREVLEAVRVREARGSYSHRGLIARRRNTLPGALELKMKTKIEAKMCDAVALSRFRFYVRDRQESILGIAEGPPDLADPKETTQSTRINSRMLAEALRGHFEKLWADAVDVGTYLDELIESANPVSRMEVISWFSAIECGDDEVDKFLADGSGSKLYPSLPKELPIPEVVSGPSDLASK